MPFISGRRSDERLEYLLFGQLGFESRLAVFIAGFAQHGQKFLIVSFNTRLVKRIYTQQVAGDGAGLLK